MSAVISTSAAPEALLRVDGHRLRWENPSSDGTTTVTYAVLAGDYAVPRDKSTLSPSNCARMKAFASILQASPGVTEAVALHELREAFAAWSAAANIEFVQIAEPQAANIVIGAEDTPQERAFANLSTRTRPAAASPVAKALGEASAVVEPAKAEAGDGPIAIDQAYVCLNRSAAWKVGFDGDLDVYDLRYTFMHEIGHAIGLDHPERPGAIMYHRYDENVHGLQASDLAAVRELYGARR